MQAPHSRPVPQAVATSQTDSKPSSRMRPASCLARLLATRAQVGRLVAQPAGGEGDDLLDRRAAGTAAGAGARDRHDLARRRAAALGDGGDEVALADAVAVADLGRVGQVGGAGQGRVGQRLQRVADEVAGADGGDERLRAARVAEQHRADDAPVADRELAIDAGRRVGDDRLEIAARLTGADEVDARDLELRAGHRAEVQRGRGAVVGAADRGVAGRQRVGRDARLVVDRRDESVDDAAVLGALADGDDAGQARAHRVVDDDPAVADDPHRTRELGLRTDPDRHDDEVGEQLRAVGEAQAVGAIGTDDLLGVALELDVDVQAAQRGREQRAGARVELALHEAVEQVYDGDRAALRGDAAGGLEAEQAAADDGGALDPALGGGEADGVAVGGVAERMHAGEVDAGDRRHERLRAGGEDELVVAQLVDVVEAEHPALGVDPRDHPADDEVDVVVLVPLGRAQLQRLRILAADEDLRQPHAVVRRHALAADQRDRDVGIAFAQCFAYGLAGDSAADDHDPMAHVRHGAGGGFPHRAVSVSTR